MFVDLIFFWQKRYIFFSEFVAKNNKTFIFNGLDGIVILTKKSYLLIWRVDGEEIS